MPGTEGVILKKQLPIIYVIDVSGSMGGDRIACVNDAMRESIKIMKKKAVGSPDAEVKVGVMTFSNGANFITNGLVDLEDFFWNDLSVGGLTDLGAALKELDSKLSKNSYLKSEIGYAVPVLIFMSDGQPTDNWEKPLEEVKKNNAWFRGAKKVCIAIGDDADLDVLGKISGNKEEAVIKSNDLDKLKSFIVAVSATSSMMGQSRIIDSEGNSVESNSIVKTVLDDIGDSGLEAIDVADDDIDIVPTDNGGLTESDDDFWD